MQALREIRTVSDTKIIIDLPEYFRQKEIEIIIIPYRDQPLKSTDFSKYFGIMTIENLEDEIRALREEWNRI